MLNMPKLLRYCRLSNKDELMIFVHDEHFCPSALSEENNTAAFFTLSSYGTQFIHSHHELYIFDRIIMLAHAFQVSVRRFALHILDWKPRASITSFQLHCWHGCSATNDAVLNEECMLHS